MIRQMMKRIIGLLLDVTFVTGKIRLSIMATMNLHGILPKIIAGLAKINTRDLPISPQFQLLATLRYFATSSFQQLLGDSMQISQPTVSKIIIFTEKVNNTYIIMTTNVQILLHYLPLIFIITI